MGRKHIGKYKFYFVYFSEHPLTADERKWITAHNRGKGFVRRYVSICDKNSFLQYVHSHYDGEIVQLD